MSAFKMTSNVPLDLSGSATYLEIQINSFHVMWHGSLNEKGRKEKVPSRLYVDRATCSNQDSTCNLLLM